MRDVFADSGYWIALLNPRDELHDKAIAVSSALGQARFTTSDMVLTEVLNDFGRRGGALRRTAVALVERLRRDPNTEVVRQTGIQFDQALALYGQRTDKTWGHTDCASFVIMRQRHIKGALTADRHFEQAGFTALLRGK